MIISVSSQAFLSPPYNGFLVVDTVKRMSETSSVSKVAVITTGGTIACTSDSNGHLLPTVSGEELLAPIAARFDASEFAFEVHELNRLDSSSMTFADLDELNKKIKKDSVLAVLKKGLDIDDAHFDPY